MRECEVCGTTVNVELHHVIFRSQSIVMSGMPVNFKYLCSLHHRGKDGPHRNKKTDLLYKKEIQKEIKKTLRKDYYTAFGLKKVLNLRDSQLKYIVKNCELKAEGYESEEVTRYLMGGKLYE